MFHLFSSEEVLNHLKEYQDLSYTLIENVTITPAIAPKLTQATLQGCIFPANLAIPDVLEDCLFLDCRMEDLAFIGCNLFRSQFVRCDLARSRFVSCDLSAAQFLECGMEQTEFSSCDMECIVMSSAETPTGAIAA